MHFSLAWSYEALEKSIIDNKIIGEEKGWWKWDYSDSPYADYGYNEFFNEVNELLDKRANKLLDDKLYDVEWNIRVGSMEEAMKRLDQSGLRIPFCLQPISDRKALWFIY